MSGGQEALVYFVAAMPCYLAAALLLHWARPVDGQMSPKLRWQSAETLVTGATTLAALLGFAFSIGAALGALK